MRIRLSPSLERRLPVLMVYDESSTRESLGPVQLRPRSHMALQVVHEILAGATLPQMMRATGLTSGYCWKIRRGERIPHPMYWGALRGVIKGRS